MSEPMPEKRGLPLRIKMRHTAHFVDELAHRHESSIGRLLPLSALRPNENQPRHDVGDLTDLVDSIREKGILEPILVRRLASVLLDEGESAAHFTIVAGERRYRAALEAGLFEVPVIELEVSEQEALEIALIENLQRKNLSPFEEAEGYRSLATLYRYSHEQIGKVVGKARTTITETLTLLEIPEELRQVAESAGVQSRSGLLEIARAGNPERMRELLEAASRLGLTRDGLRSRKRATAKKADSRGVSRGRRQPYRFKFRSPDRTFTLDLSFRQSVVERADLVRALEQILREIRESPE